MTSSDQVQRMLLEVPYLQANPGVAVDEVAATFGISRAQVLKDLEVLWMCGLPGGLPDDLIEIDMDAAQAGGAIRLSNADYLTRPMRFTRDEAVSLIVALRTVAEVATGQTAAYTASALAKLEQLAGSVEAGRIGIDVATGTDDVRATVASAIEAGHRLALSYDGATRGVTTTPVVDPHSITLRDGVGYLVAWSAERHDWRTYRLDRIAEATELPEPATDHGRPPDFTGWFEQSTGQVTLDLAPEAVWITEYYPIRSSEPLPDGGRRVRLAVSDPAWLRWLLLRNL